MKIKEFKEEDVEILSFILFSNFRLNINSKDNTSFKINDRINQYNYIAFFILSFNCKNIVIQNNSRSKLFLISLNKNDQIDKYFFIDFPDILRQLNNEITYKDIILLFAEKLNISEIIDDLNTKIYPIKNMDTNLTKFMNENKNIREIFVNDKREVELFFNNQNRKFYEDFNENRLENKNYSSSSFNSMDKHGLTPSQLKTLLGFLTLKGENKFLSINGGPGSGKTTLLNYVISNYLINHLINQRKQSKIDINQFISNYEQPKILMTGTTKNAVNNLIDICKIYPNDSHRWIEFEDYAFAYNFDFSLVENSENEKNNKLDFAVNKNFKSLLKFSNNIEDIEKYYVSQASKYLNNSSIEFSNVLNNIFNEIEKNNVKINNIFETINRLKISSSKCLENKHLYEHYSKYTFYSKAFKKINVKSKKQIIINESRKILNFFGSFNDDVLLDIIGDSRFSKFKRLFLSRKKLYRKIEKNIQTNIESFLPELDNLNKLIKEWNSLEFIKNDNKFMLNIINMNSEILNKILSMNFEIEMMELSIHETLDISIRRENSFLFRHIFEWKLINSVKLSKDEIFDEKAEFWNFKFFNILRIIKPIISSNLQGIDFNKIDKRYYGNLTDKQYFFDLIIIDEASQTDSKYLVPLSMLGRNVIAIGDENQLQPINNEVSDLHFLSSVYSIINEIDECKEKFIEINKIIEEYIYGPSLLSVVNKNSKIIANISEINLKGNKSNKRGFFLLEHFRCPKKIFDLVNEHFYSNSLIFRGDNSNEKCALSRKYNSLSCNDIAFIRIGHNYINPENDNTNIKEIEIGFKFIIQNYLFFYEHCYGTKPENLSLKSILSKLISKVAFITFYKNQGNKIKESINFNQLNKFVSDEKQTDDWIYFFKRIKKGTVDSLQGIGCEFIIFSNVSNYYTYSNSEDKRKFEFDDKRINVLWSRTKAHFIHIMSNKYWVNFVDRKDDYFDSLAVKARVNAEININFNRLSLQENNFDININENKNRSNIEITGRHGEELFHLILQEPYLKSIFIEKINKKMRENLSIFASHVWNNEENESYQNHDFSISSKGEIFYLEIKTNKNNNVNLWMSDNEFNFANENRDHWALIHLLEISSLSNLKYIDQSIQHFIVDKMKIYLVNEISKIDSEFSGRFKIKIT